MEIILAMCVGAIISFISVMTGIAFERSKHLTDVDEDI